MSADPFEIEVFFDGGCPLCRREIDLLRCRDRGQRIRFTDLETLDPAAANLGKSSAELMARMHARLPDGSWVEGVEVFRRMYSAVGFRRLVALSRLPVVSPLLAAAYAVFARNRLRLTGRCTTASCSADASRRLHPAPPSGPRG
ncbi:MAG: DUF393 domain-containing protein [Pirellulales bacterium]|nr:DUF393 domain-containing protein [Pirellulales bacterium]